MTDSPTHQQTVLVVEDEGIVRLDAVESLREAGFDVVEAHDAAEALEIVGRRNDIDLLFTDINMPGAMDGVELARLIRRSHPTIRLVLTSGEVKLAPADIPGEGAFLPKPYSSEAVAALVSRSLAA